MRKRIDWNAGGWVEFRCPGCRSYMLTVPEGTPIARAYCRACGLKIVEHVAAPPRDEPGRRTTSSTAAHTSAQRVALEPVPPSAVPEHAAIAPPAAPYAPYAPPEAPERRPEAHGHPQTATAALRPE